MGEESPLPQHPHTRSQSPAQDTWTNNASSWTPSKTASLLPTSLPVPKPHKAWERVAKPPVAQNSRVKQVWRREYGLRSQSSTEEKVEEDEAPEKRQRSPTRIVKKKRTRSPTKKSLGEADDEGKPNHAPTRWENRRTSLRRKVSGQQTNGLGTVWDEGDASNSPSRPTEEIQQAELHGNNHIEKSIAQGKNHDAVMSGAGGSPDIKMSERLHEENLPDPHPATLFSKKTMLNGVEKPCDAQFPSNTLEDREKDEYARSDSPAPEDFYRQETTDSADQDQTLDTLVGVSNLSATELDASVEAAREDETFVLQSDEVTYPSLTISDIERSPCKLRDILNIDEGIARKLEAVVESSLPSQLDPAELGSNETLGLQLEQAEAILQRTPEKASQVDDFDITAGLQLELLGSTKKRTSASPAGILKIVSTITNHDLSAEDEDSPPSSPDELTMDFDATETLSVGHLEDDKARLRSFLNRAAANKASKVATTHRRESAQSRRDSDVIRQALASPRPVLEDKDTNLSPTRNLDFLNEPTMTLDKIIATPVASTKRALEDDADLDPLALDSKHEEGMEIDLPPGSPRRRSKRKQSRIPHAPTAAKIPNKIPVRTDGSERVVLNKSGAQELANLMRKNTRKNKGGAISAPERLLKLRAEVELGLITGVGSSAEITRELKVGDKGVRWKEQLVEFSDSVATADLMEGTSTDEPALGIEGVVIIEPSKLKEKKTGTSRLRRLKGLGGTNGTPAKGVLASTLLPEEVEEETAEAAAKVKAKADSALAASTTVVKRESKSRIQPPKKLMLNPSVTSLSGLPVLAGKENSLLLSPPKKIAAPAKGKIPVPSSTAAAATAAGDTTGARPVKRLRAPRKL
ncbi:hypothetical protein E6O75_ATG08461 [Venturia nashicola]|uniref:Uncharacterized protein n=1 Tax=Venturia nashicola TaxID=86259 RepID=A0A4Z1P3I6_9PEZI|nr:hypothetical protein E6O75_ATG08461 [Venturia nashicola]